MQYLKLPITKILILAFLIRMLISFLPAFEIDQNDWRLWSVRLAQGGSLNFYSENTFTDYTPGFLYFLWFAGIIKTTLLASLPYNAPIYDLLLKLPANIADVLTGLLIYFIIKRLGEKKAILASMLYIFNPAIFFNSSIWGQFDGISTFLILLATVLLLFKKQPETSASLAAVALTFKPQAILFTPAFGILFFLSTKPKRLFTSFMVFLATMILIYLPFMPGNPIYQFININTSVANVFNCTTCFAFNFWGLFGNWKSDSNLFLNISLINWGLILTIISLVLIILIKPFKLKYHYPYIYLTTALSIIACYTFLTRMHERYLFPFFCFFLISAFLLKSKKLIYFYFLFSIISLINQYLPYAYYNYVYTNKLDIFSPPFVDVLTNNFKVISAIFLLSFILLLITFMKIISGINKHENL